MDKCDTEHPSATIFMFTGNNSPDHDNKFNVILFLPSEHMNSQYGHDCQMSAAIAITIQSTYPLYPCGWCLSEQPWTVSSPSSFSEKRTNNRNTKWHSGVQFDNDGGPEWKPARVVIYFIEQKTRNQLYCLQQRFLATLHNQHQHTQNGS